VAAYKFTSFKVFYLIFNKKIFLTTSSTDGSLGEIYKIKEYKTNVSDVNHIWLDANIAWLFMAIAKKIRSWSFTRRHAL